MLVGNPSTSTTIAPICDQFTCATYGPEVFFLFSFFFCKLCESKSQLFPSFPSFPFLPSLFSRTISINQDPANENSGGYASGGGFSVYETRPSYQNTVVAAYLNNATIPKPPSHFYNS